MRLTSLTFTLLYMDMPRCLKTFASRSPTSGSYLSSILLCLLMIMTSLVPRAHHACAISHATAPSPIIASERGAFFELVAFLLVHGRAYTNPCISDGITALLPVLNTTA